ncbi:MAG TPA: toll/interleukin-1 receptor domain-containing protein [Micromonosporaceae bacterium]
MGLRLRWQRRLGRPVPKSPDGDGGHVFLSYAREDLRYVRQLHEFLVAEGIDVWFDKDLEPGERWTSTIEANIDKCAVMVVVWSAAAAKSQWVTGEYLRAQQAGRPILPLQLDDTLLPVALNAVQSTIALDGRMPGPDFLRCLVELSTANPTAPRRPDAAPDGDGRFVERDYGGLVLPVLRSLDRVLRSLGEQAPLVVDDCVRLYRTRSGASWADGIAVTALAEPADPLARSVGKAAAEALIHEADVDPEIADYLRARSAPDPSQEFWAKVSLRRIVFDNDQIPGSELRLHVRPMSYWIEQEVNRRFVGTTDAVFESLRERELAKVFAGRPPDGYTLAIPNTLYTEVALLTADGSLMLMRKPVDAGGVYAQHGRPWTCGVERSLNWNQAQPGTGRLRPREPVIAAIGSELGLAAEDVASIEWCAVALEGHLNTALLGIARLRRTSADFAGHHFPRIEFVEFVAVADVPRRVFSPAVDWGWHTTARMRALLALQRALGSEREANQLVSLARQSNRPVA